MKYYKSYSINGEPFTSLERLKSYMRQNNMPSALISVYFHRRHSGVVDVIKEKTIKVKTNNKLITDNKDNQYE